MEPTVQNPVNPIETLPQLAPLAGSVGWQLVILLLVALFLITRVIRGMQLGGARQGVSLAALGLGIAAGWFGGGAMVPLLRGFLSMPDFLLRGIGSATLCLVIILVVEVLGMIFCGKTEEQKTPERRRLYAWTGVLLGFVNGCLVVLLALAGLNLLGAVANAKLVAELNALNQSIAANPPPPRDPNAPPRETDKLQGPTVVTTTVGDPLTVFLARLGNSLNLGVGESVMNTIDPVPENIPRVLQKAVTVLTDPACSERLFALPEINRISQHERVAQLAQDKDIQRLAETRDILGLLRHPMVVEAANDPDVQKDFASIDLEKSLDHALAARKDTLGDALRKGEVKINSEP